ncbi:hypothetical protein Caka_1019 [Coraliomargarita akajimensis DSM 45221]|uniref:GH16 domain-containing protein n=1 Tax=Coraliomargarita akajimensis (strain DSM 45221 / IAM 15411 / JCM 23193 / KCTC 12865 / 04OKA010-24) TaxID=583355 RepID=D5EHK0_CORAD|nr:hypothetical protein Caka_1019 [Coraliomargarita akajimensis DSM 45221]
MKIPKARCKLRISACVAVATLLTSAPLTVQAQSKLSAPGGWTIYNWATDYFNDTNLGWQWTDVAPSWWLYEKSDNRPERGGVTWSKFRQDNVIMDGNSLVVRNRYHYTPQSGGWSGRYNQNVNTYTYSGGWLESKASWLVEGQYQANSKVDWNFADIWPTFWLTYTGNGGHELDIMQYQLNALDHSHIVWKANSGGIQGSSQRSWNPWTTPKWEHDWALARVRSWSNWACRTTRNSPATFYINGKLEHTSPLAYVNSGMKLIFSSSPHKSWRPLPGNYPSFRVNWVETHIP